MGAGFLCEKTDVFPDLREFVQTFIAAEPEPYLETI